MAGTRISLNTFNKQDLFWTAALSLFEATFENFINLYLLTYALGPLPSPSTTVFVFLTTPSPHNPLIQVEYIEYLLTR